MTKFFNVVLKYFISLNLSHHQYPILCWSKLHTIPPKPGISYSSVNIKRCFIIVYGPMHHRLHMEFEIKLICLDMNYEHVFHLLIWLQLDLGMHAIIIHNVRIFCDISDILSVLNFQFYSHPFGLLNGLRGNHAKTQCQLSNPMGYGWIQHVGSVNTFQINKMKSTHLCDIQHISGCKQALNYTLLILSTYNTIQ